MQKITDLGNLSVEVFFKKNIFTAKHLYSCFVGTINASLIDNQILEPVNCKT